MSLIFGAGEVVSKESTKRLTTAQSGGRRVRLREDCDYTNPIRHRHLFRKELGLFNDGIEMPIPFKPDATLEGMVSGPQQPNVLEMRVGGPGVPPEYNLLRLWGEAQANHLELYVPFTSCVPC